jgi:D-glycero-alpha-D-manno-heptose-7-phosphate kinase
MIVAKCPLRFSLAGGSTDLQDFIDKNGHGAVISFPGTVYTYITVHNNNRGLYIINYTKREEAKNIDNIKNDIAREVLKEFDCEPITITFNTDVQTVGSGLASSSSYLISTIGAISRYKGIEMSNFEICKLALKIERKFNPLTGYQDPYGCGIGSFKKMVFRKNEDPTIEYLEHSLFNNLSMYIRYTGVQRSSTSVLSKIIKSDRRVLLQKVSELQEFVKNEDKERFLDCITEGWKEKKRTSPHILENTHIKNIDLNLEKDENILSHRLCGAGNGGYFLVFTKESYKLGKEYIKLSIDHKGLEVREV